MAVGDVIRLSSTNRSVAIPNRLGPRDAMAQTLAAFLLGIQFRVAGGDDRDTVFRLREVFNQWPGSRQDLPYPCASIIDQGSLVYLPHNLTPTILEETWGVFDQLVDDPPNGENNTVLMKEHGGRQDFQVDFWLDKIADRQAVAALLPSALSPEEGRDGVIVEGPELYYSRSVRFSLMGSTHDDSGATASLNERRLRTTIRAECDIVSLRMATTTKKPTICLAVTDPSDPPETGA
jgi:hypothetical protein